MSRTLVIMMAVFAISACGTASKKDFCNNTDWKEEGRKSGQQGNSADVVMKDQRACADLGIEISLEDYKSGWDEGIQEYCSEESAFDLGKKSEKHKVENCPIVFRPNFLASYEKGQKLKDVNQKIEKVEKKMSDADAEKAKLQKEVAAKRQKIEKLESKESDLKTKKENLIEEKQHN